MNRHLPAFLTAALVLVTAVVQYLANQPAVPGQANPEPASTMPALVQEECTVYETVQESCGTVRIVRARRNAGFAPRQRRPVVASLLPGVGLYTV